MGVPSPTSEPVIESFPDLANWPPVLVLPITIVEAVKGERHKTILPSVCVPPDPDISMPVTPPATKAISSSSKLI